MNFPEEYQHARSLFVDAAENAGFRHMRYKISHEENPELYQDYAFLRRNPKKLLIQISGVHGIEGYMGSAIQRALLEEKISDEGPSLLFVHALNPFGMALYRRANGENVDLNRNFRKGPAKPNPDYEYFNSYLNPTSRLEFYTGVVKGFANRHRIGRARTNQAVAAGQVKFPKGLFYMGERVQREVFLLQEFLRAHGKDAEEVVVIDLHSGLGAFGDENLFVDRDSEPTAPEFFTTAFDRPVSAADPNAGFYKNQGPLSEAIKDALPMAKMLYALQEFGAHSAGFTLNALREENFEWHVRPAGAERPESIRSSMLEAFLPRNTAWRENVLKTGILRWKQALAAL